MDLSSAAVAFLAAVTLVIGRFPLRCLTESNITPVIRYGQGGERNLLISIPDAVGYHGGVATIPAMPESLDAFIPQQRNANKHSQRGQGMLNTSLHSVGWFGAMTSAANGEMFDGSLRLEEVAQVFNGVEPIIVETDGTRPVINRRIDIPTADDPKAIAASIYANRTAEVSLNWEHEVLGDWEAEGVVDLSEWWRDDEMEDWGVEDAAALGEDDDDGVGMSDTKEIDCVCPNCGHSFVKQH